MRAVALVAMLALSCCTPRGENASLSPELEQALSLIECPPQTVEGDGERWGVRDCANFKSYRWSGADRSGLAIRYALMPGSPLEAATIQFVSRSGIEKIFEERDVDPDAHGFMVSLDPEGGDDIAIPVVREDGNLALSIWLSDSLEARLKSRPSFVYAGDIPAGVVAAWRPECGLFGVSKPPHTNPWRLTLYRTKDIQEYRAKRLGFDELGELAVSKDAAGKCTISGADAISLSGLSAGEFDDELCHWLEDSGLGVLRVPDC